MSSLISWIFCSVSVLTLPPASAISPLSKVFSNPSINLNISLVLVLAVIFVLPNFKIGALDNLSAFSAALCLTSSFNCFIKSDWVSSQLDLNA